MPSEPRPTTNRRTLLAGGVFAGAGLVAIARNGMGQTPVASPIASPIATPAASPVASPVLQITLPGTNPTHIMEVIRDQRPEEQESPVTGGELRLHVASAGIADFNVSAFRQDFQVSASIYDPLVWIDDVSCEPVPWLAESWAWSNDGRRLTFTLRPDVVWHDGDPLTAEDVAFSFTVYQQDYASAVAGFFSLVTAITTVDDRTVQVDFSEPDGSFVFNAGNLFVIKASQYAFAWTTRDMGERSLDGYDWAANAAVGTGPWRVEEVTAHRVTLARHSAYWAGAPYADRLILIAEDDHAARIGAWKEDDVDLVWPLTPVETVDILGEAGRLYTADTLRTSFAAFNFQNPTRFDPAIFASIELRQALQLAMDREGYRQAVFGSLIDMTRANPVVQPWAQDDRWPLVERNTAYANELLDGLGWIDNDGDGIREAASGDVLALTAIVEASAPAELVAVLRQLDTDWREIGVSLDVQVLDIATWSDRWVNQHDFDLIAYDILTYPSFDEFDLYGTAWDIRTNTGGWNPGGYSNEAVDAALAAWFASYEIEDMRIALLNLQRAVSTNPFGVFFGSPQDAVIVRPGVRGYRPNKVWQAWNTRTMWKTPT
jgi:peptide/nickel transport system substrate-binding protein